VTELDDVTLDDAMATIDHDLTDPRSADGTRSSARCSKAPAVTTTPKAQPGESTQAYKVREGNWRERHGMPRKRKSVPPSRTRRLAACSGRLSRPSRRSSTGLARSTALPYVDLGAWTAGLDSAE
jgi:hypothetical protein